MECPVCGREKSSALCPECGFDTSRDYEKHPTLSPVRDVPAISALRSRWQHREPQETGKKRSCFSVLACAAMLILGIVIGMAIGGGASGEKSSEEPREESRRVSWEENVLEVPGNIYSNNVEIYPVFGSKYRRKQIRTVTFVDTLANAPADAWDVSVGGDGRVLAWVIPNGELYDLYIGGEGGVSVGESCRDLFAGYWNVNHFWFGDAFHTENVQDMSYMFSECYDLTSLDLTSFNTTNVQNMDSMFFECYNLTSLDLSSFNTTNVQNMNSMFYNCPAGDDWQHLLK